MTQKRDVRVIVKVQSNAGLPLEGVFVSLESAVVALPEIALTTNAQGEVEIVLPVGPARVRADKEGHHAMAEFNADLQQENEPFQVLLVIPLDS